MSSTRQVVTGHRHDGRSTVVRDEVREGVTSVGTPGMELLYLWGADDPQSYPDDGAMPQWVSHFPPVGGVRLVVCTLTNTAGIELEGAGTPDAVADAKRKFPGLLDTYQDDEPGMHTSDTTDYAVVLSGEIVLGLSDGAEVVLREGDTLVQNGTAHSWTNRQTEPARILFVLIGASRRTADATSPREENK